MIEFAEHSATTASACGKHSGAAVVSMIVSDKPSVQVSHWKLSHNINKIMIRSVAAACDEAALSQRMCEAARLH